MVVVWCLIRSPNSLLRVANASASAAFSRQCRVAFRPERRDDGVKVG